MSSEPPALGYRAARLFLHEDHQSPGREANRVIERFRRLPAQERQDGMFCR
jgi:hypothetical protein